MEDQWNRTALLVIDMQKDFIDEGSAFALPGARAILPSVYRAVEIARKRGVFIIWVVREHDREGRDVERFRRHYYGNGELKPAAKGSRGAELVEGLEIKEGDYKLVKTRVWVLLIWLSLVFKRQTVSDRQFLMLCLWITIQSLFLVMQRQLPLPKSIRIISLT